MRFAFLLAVFAVTHIAPSAQAQAKKRGPIFWHNQIGAQAQFISQRVAEFNVRLLSGESPLRSETGLELETQLLAELPDARRPDLVLMPSDLLSQHARLGLRELSPHWLDPTNPAQPGTDGGRVYGVPILGGNHLLLAFNKKWITEPIHRWEDLPAQIAQLNHPPASLKPLGWPVRSAYYLLPYLDAAGQWPAPQKPLLTQGPAVEGAIARYREVARLGQVPLDCAEDCAAEKFYAGQFAYAIIGDWALLDASRHLGHDLGVTGLPTFHGAALPSPGAYHLLVSPRKSSNPIVAAELQRFALFLQSAAVQTRWSREALRIPALPSARTAKNVSALQRSSLEVFRTADLIGSPSGLGVAWSKLQRRLRESPEGPAP